MRAAAAELDKDNFRRKIVIPGAWRLPTMPIREQLIVELYSGNSSFREMQMAKPRR